MTTAEARARGEILEAAARLTRGGLIQRTWGNISARVSETEMLITPSGLAYDTLREDQLVLINLRDGSCIGCAEPSSERGIHADAYRLRPETNFVIHTRTGPLSSAPPARRSPDSSIPSSGSGSPAPPTACPEPGGCGGRWRRRSWPGRTAVYS